MGLQQARTAVASTALPQHGVLKRSGGFHIKSNSPTASSAAAFLKRYEKGAGYEGLRCASRKS